jgi:hypothetical protein
MAGLGMTLVCATFLAVTEAQAQRQSALTSAGDRGFVLTPEAHDQLRRDHLLAAQIIENLTAGLSRPIHSRAAEGKTNFDSSYDYSYKVRVTAHSTGVTLDFVFNHAEHKPTPAPIRVIIDEFGNALTTALTGKELESVRSDVQTSCSQLAITNGLDSLAGLLLVDPSTPRMADRNEF